MGSVDWKNWILGLIIVLGLCFEAFKLLPQNALTWEGDPFTKMGTESKNVSGRSHPAKQHKTASHQHEIKPAPQAKPLAPAPLETSEMSFDEGEGKGAEQVIAQKAEEDGQKKKKKKKKKKKAEEVAQEEAVPEALPEPKKTAEPQTPPSYPRGDVVTTTRVVPNAAKQDDKTQNKMTVEEWVELLSQQPTAENRARFVKAYKNREIQGATFYKVEDALLADSKLEVKTLAVDALGETPSATSFIILAELSKDPKFETSLQPKVDGYLNNYIEVKHLTVLRTILQSSDNAAAAIVAAQKLEAAIHKVSVPPTTPPPDGAPGTSDTTGRAYVAYFQPFVPVLDNLVKSNDPAVAAQATQTLATLQTYLQSNAPNTAQL